MKIASKSLIIAALAIICVLVAITAPYFLGHLWTSGTSKQKSILVLSGAGLMNPVNELIDMYEEREGVNVEVDYGGSGEEFSKLSMGIGDVFIPGAYYYMEIAIENGYVIPETVVNITLHIPVIAVPKGNPKNIGGLEDLLKPGVRLAMANPKAAAIGKVARKIFEKNGLDDELMEKYERGEMVEAPTANQLLLYVATGQVDAAIIWEDMVTWAQSKKKVEIIEIPREMNIIKTIPAAVTVYAKEHGVYEEAKKFVEFISTGEGLEI